MSSSVQRTSIAVLTLCAACVTGAALAWACTPSANITITPASGSPGASVQVSGSNYVANAPVEIRWNGVGGQLLGAVTASPQGTFSTSVTIPAGKPDTHTVVGVSGQFAATASYTIVGGGASSPPTPGTSPAPETGRSNDSSGTTSGGSAQDRRPNGSDGLSARGHFQTGAGSTDRQGSGNGGDLRAADGGQGVVSAENGDSVFADSTAPGGGKGASGGSKASPSGRSGAADLWAGFGSPGSTLLGDADASPATGGSMPGLSVALLALGLAAGLGGLGLAGARRRARARSGANSG